MFKLDNNEKSVMIRKEAIFFYDLSLHSQFDMLQIAHEIAELYTDNYSKSKLYKETEDFIISYNNEDEDETESITWLFDEIETFLNDELINLETDYFIGYNNGSWGMFHSESVE